METIRVSSGVDVAVNRKSTRRGLSANLSSNSTFPSAELVAVNSPSTMTIPWSVESSALNWSSYCLSCRSAASCSSFVGDRKSTRLNSSHYNISYAVFCLNNIFDSRCDGLGLLKSRSGLSQGVERCCEAKKNEEEGDSVIFFEGTGNGRVLPIYPPPGFPD